MTRSKQTGPDLFDSLGLVDVPLFDVDTDTAEIVAPEPTDTDTAMLTAALTTGYYELTGYYEPTADQVAEHEADAADTAEPVDLWEGAVVLTVDADLNAVTLPYGTGRTSDGGPYPNGDASRKAGAWLEVPQDDDDDDDDGLSGEDDDDEPEDSDERASLAEREIRLTWTVTTRYEWEGTVGDLPEQVQAALRLNSWGDVEFDDDDADWTAVESNLPDGDVYDTETEVDEVDEV